MPPSHGHHLHPRQDRQRVPAVERREALIDAAVHEFAHAGLHGTPVDRIARRVGVAQPFVFSPFGSKKELFLTPVERGFQLVGETFARAAAHFEPSLVRQGGDVLHGLKAPASERLDECFRYGIWINVAAAMGVRGPLAGREWVRAERDRKDRAGS